MSIHFSTVLRKFLKEIYHSTNLRKYFNSCFYHIKYFLKIQIFFNNFLNVRHCYFIEYVVIHCLNVFSIHPFKFLNIKN